MLGAAGVFFFWFGPARPGPSSPVQAVRLGGLRAPPGELGPRSRLARDAERAELGAVRPKWSGAPSEHRRIAALWWEAERDPAGFPEVGEVLPRPSKPSSFADSSLASFLPYLRKLFDGCFPSLLFFSCGCRTVSDTSDLRMDLWAEASLCSCGRDVLLFQLCAFLESCLCCCSFLGRLNRWRSVFGALDTSELFVESCVLQER